MNLKSMMLIAGLVAGVLSMGASAQPASGVASDASGPGNTVTDCAKAKRPARCEARQKAREACKDKTGVERRQCVMANMPQRDCSKAKNPARCEARQKAREACKDKTGVERRQCVMANMPQRDCSKAKNPVRCEARQKAREACKDKSGREHKQCMREQFKPATDAAK